MIFGSVPEGRTTTRPSSAEPEAQPDRRGHVLGPEREVVDLLDREPAERRRRLVAQPVDDRRDRGEVVHPHRELVGGVQAVLAGEVVEQVTQRAPGRLRARGDVADHHQRRDAVLVLHVRRVHAVAERLLVAEGEVLDAADPLEAGQRLGVQLLLGDRHLAQQRRRDDRGRVDALAPQRQQVLAEQRTDLVAAQHLPAVRAGDGDGAAVGVGVVGHDDVGVDLLGQRHREVHRAGFLGVGEGHGREVGVGLGLGRRDVGLGETGLLQRGDDGGAADAVQRRVDDVRGRADRHRRGRPRSRGSGRGPGRRAPRRRHRGGCPRRHRPPRSARRSPRRRAARSGCRRRGRPCSRCPAAGCGSPSPSRRRRSRGAGSRTRAGEWAAVAAARTPSCRRRSSPRRCRGRRRRSCGGRRSRSRRSRRRSRRSRGGTPRARPPRAAPRPGSSGWGRRRGHHADRRCRTRGCRRTGRRARRVAPCSISASSSALVTGSGSCVAHSRARSRRSASLMVSTYRRISPARPGGGAPRRRAGSRSRPGPPRAASARPGRSRGRRTPPSGS